MSAVDSPETLSSDRRLAVGLRSVLDQDRYPLIRVHRFFAAEYGSEFLQLVVHIGHGDNPWKYQRRIWDRVGRVDLGKIDIREIADDIESRCAGLAEADWL